jgi:hypothetical protein
MALAHPHRGNRSRLALALALIFLLGPASAARAELPAKSVHGVNSAAYQAWIDAMRKEGYRAITVSAYGAPADPHYAASAIKDGKNYPWEARHNLTTAQHQKTFNELSKKGYRAICFSVYSHNKDFNVASLWVKDGANFGWVGKTGMTAVTFQKEFDANVKRGLRALQIQGYPAGKETHFAAIFVADGNKTWVARHHINAADYQRMFDEWPKKGYRPLSISAYPAGSETRFAMTFVKDGVSVDSEARHGLTAAQYQAEFTRLSKLGYRPLQVCGYPVGKETRYAAVFVGDRSAGSLAVGQWSPVMQWPVVAIHAAMLPNGKVLVFPRLEDDPPLNLVADSYENSNKWPKPKPRSPESGYPHLWDPAKPDAKLIVTPRPPYSLFCSGHAFLPDGRLFFAGGHLYRNFSGEKRACIYDPFRNSWLQVASMNWRRWYPSCVTLADGDVLVAGGTFDFGQFTTMPQVWPARGSFWRDLSKADNDDKAPLVPYYPFLHVAPNGMVFQAGPNIKTFYLDPADQGRWIAVGDRAFRKDRDYGSSVMYEPGKVLVLGGSLPPTATAETIDLNVVKPAWRSTESMRHARRQQNATLLADGTVFVSGGTSTATPFKYPNSDILEVNPNGDLRGAVFNTEIWNPKTGKWTLMAPQSDVRIYHSTALLLPDGRVLSCGGGEPPADPPDSGDKDHRTAQIYSPPYLFNGPRPVISSAPQFVGYGKTITVATPDADHIGRVNLIRLGSATHARNFDQRLNHLAFKAQKGSLSITAPANGNLAPPGGYMLFILNAKGVPSVAKIIRLG